MYFLHKRAVDKVYEQIEEGKGTKKKIYTFGPIIHNEEVVRDLEKKGVQVLETEEELKKLKEGTVIIRSHGVSRHIYEILNRDGIELVDATCPFYPKTEACSFRYCNAHIFSPRPCSFAILIISAAISSIVI